jgi:hypothetical protein
MNDRSDKLVYRKTEAGVAEIKTRKAGLDGRTRTLLILVNGVLSANDLATHVGYDPRPVLAALAAEGLVEAVEVAANRTLPRAAPKPAAAPAPAPAPAAAGPATDPGPTTMGPTTISSVVDMKAVIQRAMVVLVPLYGPDATSVVQPLLRVHTREGFDGVMADMEAKLSVPVGKKRAAELILHIRGEG